MLKVRENPAQRAKQSMRSRSGRIGVNPLYRFFFRARDFLELVKNFAAQAVIDDAGGNRCRGRHAAAQRTTTFYGGTEHVR